MYRINSSRLRHIIGFNSSITDDYGETIVKLIPDFQVRAEVQVKTGTQVANYGKELTSEVITVLVYFDERITNKLWLLWNDKRYRIEHVQTDTMNQSSIITAELIS